MMLNPNMTLEEFTRLFGGLEPAPWQRRQMRDIERGVPLPRMLNAHPYRPSREDTQKV